MHRALNIPEVIRLIVEELLDEDDPSAFAALSSCKAFFEAAISLLWRDRTLAWVINLSDVLMHWNNEDHRQQKQFTIADRRDRFHLYTASIHSIYWKAEELPGVSIQNLRLLTPPNVPYIFSNLRSLEAAVVGPEDYQVVSTLICPSLETLIVREMIGIFHPLPSVEDEQPYVVPVGYLLDTISEVSTNLRSLTFGIGDRISHAHVSALAKTFQSLTKLDYFSHNIRTWSDDWMEKLAGCTQLSEMYVTGHHAGTIGSNPALRFSSLYTLTLRTYSNLPDEAFFCMMPNLQYFNITAFRMTEQSRFQPRELRSMSMGISYCVQLTYLRVVLGTAPLCDAPALWEAFSSISRCVLLQECDIGCLAGPEFDPDDIHVQKLTRDMRRLNRLDISHSTIGGEREGQPSLGIGLTAASLRHLAENCPLIEDISFRELDFNQLVPPPAGPPRKTPVRLCLNRAPSRKPHLAAAFLTAVWPEVDFTLVDSMGRALPYQGNLSECLETIRSVKVLEDMKNMDESEAEAMLEELMA